MTEKEREEHMQEVTQYSIGLSAATRESAWKTFKKHCKNSGKPVPAEIEDYVKAFYFSGYAQGICCGIEDTIIRYNRMFNCGVAGEA